jgi:cytochrome c
MEIRGAPEQTDRVNLIAYLRTLSDKPLPLP